MTGPGGAAARPGPAAGHNAGDAPLHHPPAGRSSLTGGRRKPTTSIIAALFGLHPADSDSGNIGRSFAAAKDKDGNAEAIERRFAVLLAAYPDDLAVSAAAGHSVLALEGIARQPSQLLRDVLSWDNPTAQRAAQLGARFLQKILDQI